MFLDCLEEAHFQAVSSYIHLNPVRARLIRAGEEPLGGYRWSTRAWLARRIRAPARRFVWARAEVDARRRIERGLEALGIPGKTLPELPKGAQEKLALAWWSRRHTTQSRKWIAGRLHMGHESRVTLAVREVSRSRRGRLARIRKLLEKLSVATKTA